MKKNMKTIVGIAIGLIIGISMTVGAATIFNSKDITYSSDKTTKNNVKDSLDELYIKAAKVGACPEGYKCIELKPISTVNIGDYISTTPTSTNYTIPTNETGYTSAQTINPSELNLWRVIKKNDDGTVDVVSEYISSVDIYFYGKVGYMNLVGELNTIAAQYTDGKHVQSTRHMGYSNQIEKCATLSSTDCPSDTGYQIDKDLVETAIGNLKALRINHSYGQFSWYASRNIDSSRGRYSGRTIFIGDGYTKSYYLFDGNEESGAFGAIRPILTLKADVQIVSGDGQSEVTAYQLN